MLASQRRKRIADELRRSGGVRVTDLATMLDVSDMTVRRDLEVMQESGILEKVHGGAVPASQSAEEPGFALKRERGTAEKAAISRAAAALISPGASVALSAGTTTWALADVIPQIPRVTVLTNSVSVAERLHLAGLDHAVVLTGGTRTPSDALVGPIADESIRSLYVDLLFLGVHGMDPEAGFTTPNLAEAETNRVLIACARRVVVVADHTKWRVIGLSRIAPFDTADVLVTDDGLDAEAQQLLSERVGELVVARLDGPEQESRTQHRA